MNEMDAALERRKAKREKLNLAKYKRAEKEAVKVALQSNDHTRCQGSHQWYEAIDPSDFRRNVEICSEESLEELAWAAERFGWKVTNKGLWSERVNLH